MTENFTLLIAIFSALATGFAAFATWSAPRSAAKLAEALRRDAERQDESQKRKMQILTTLMQERAQIYSQDGVRALNLIDIVFNDSREVREAWAELLLAFSLKPIPPHVVEERLRKLLGAIAKDVGLTDQLRTDDLGRVYQPEYQAQEQFIRDVQRQQIFARLLQGHNPAGASGAGLQNTEWPPKPGNV